MGSATELFNIIDIPLVENSASNSLAYPEGWSRLWRARGALLMGGKVKDLTTLVNVLTLTSLRLKF